MIFYLRLKPVSFKKPQKPPDDITRLAARGRKSFIVKIYVCMAQNRRKTLTNYVFDVYVVFRINFEQFHCKKCLQNSALTKPSIQ